MTHTRTPHHGQQLRKLLAAHDMTGSECARRLACTRQAVSLMVRSAELRIARVRQLVRIFKVPMRYFIGS